MENISSHSIRVLLSSLSFLGSSHASSSGSGPIKMEDISSYSIRVLLSSLLLPTALADFSSTPFVVITVVVVIPGNAVLYKIALVVIIVLFPTGITLVSSKVVSSMVFIRG